MISYDEALSRLLGAARPLAITDVSIDDAAGRVLAQDVVAALDSPRAHVSAMDGYAVELSSAKSGAWLDVVGESAAGAPFERAIDTNQAVRIFTGAHVPTGADCVVMQEYAQREADRVRFRDGFGPEAHIRFTGSDFAESDTLLRAGERLTPRAMVTLAAADIGMIAVSKRPRLAIIATGDELERPGTARLSDHGMPESASFGVAAMADSCGGHVVQQVHGRDDLESLSPLVDQALAAADCVVVVGGASVGDHDLARPMFAQTSFQELFARVAIKPGKPVWFGMADGTPVLGLPGNPTSAMVTARLFLKPLLAAMQGACGTREVAFLPHILACDLPANGSRETFVRATATPEGLVPATNQQSGAQAPLASSDWLIRREKGQGPLAAGERVAALSF